jgi:putative membrane protein
MPTGVSLSAFGALLRLRGVTFSGVGGSKTWVKYAGIRSRSCLRSPIGVAYSGDKQHHGRRCPRASERLSYLPVLTIILSEERIKDMGLLVGTIIAILIDALVIWIVSKLKLGLTVGSFANAIVAAIVIAVVAAVIAWLFGLVGITIGGGLLGAIITLIVAAVVLLVSDKFLPGLKVAGFGGAIVAAIAMAVLFWLVSLVLGMFGLA